jgi:hypothetical protein
MPDVDLIAELLNQPNPWEHAAALRACAIAHQGDYGRCPFRVRNVPDGCVGGCVTEPRCITDEPTGGWASDPWHSRDVARTARNIGRDLRSWPVRF